MADTPKIIIDPAVILPGFLGPWSPTANHLAGIHWVNEENGVLSLAAAPGFKQKAILSPEFIFTGSTFGYEVTWKPDGEWLLFGGSDKFGPVGEVTTPWAVMLSGENPHPILENSYLGRWMHIPGWLDSETMILTDYMGGGTRAVHMVDFRSGNTQAAANINGSIFPGRLIGAPFEIDSCGATIGILTIQEQPEMSLLTGSKYARMIPVDGVNCSFGGMHFLTWHPDQDKIVAVMENLWGHRVYRQFNW